jgi:hypothetical protein
MIRQIRVLGAPIACVLSVCIITPADAPTITQVDWDTRTASCPATVTQQTNLTIRTTNINDLLVDFKSGEPAQYQLRAKGTPVSVVPPENPFTSQAAQTTVCNETTVLNDLNTIRNFNDPKITPPQPGGAYIPVSETMTAAHLHTEVTRVEADYASSDPTCTAFFTAHSTDLVVQWIKLLDAPLTSGSSTAPAHSIDFNVNLQPNQNYQFTIRESWKGKTVEGASLTWNCGESDVLTLSAGPIITTLPYRTYSQQSVPNPTGGGTTNELVVNGNTNVLAAALLNYHFPSIPHVPTWTGLAFSIGPVYALGDAPSVSKLGLFVGGSIHLYRSVFFTPGVQIGQFADFPTGFHAGSPIPPGFGTLTPVTRNTARFAFGITFKTTTFKKSSQNAGTASNAGTNSNTKPQPAQNTSGSHGGTPAP